MKVVVTHIETAELNAGDLVPAAVASLLRSGDWTLDDLVNPDWKIEKIEIDGKEMP